MVCVFYYVSRWLGQVEKARKYTITMLMIGTTMSRLNHLEYPAFEKMNQNGRMITAIIINHINRPKDPIFICMLLVISSMEFPLRIVC